MAYYRARTRDWELEALYAPSDPSALPLEPDVQAAVELEVSHEAADIVAETPPEPVIDVAPETTVLEVDEPDSVKHLEPTPALEVVLALAEPEAPAAPDPAEILAPPAAPKRGWWRRG